MASTSPMALTMGVSHSLPSFRRFREWWPFGLLIFSLAPTFGLGLLVILRLWARQLFWRGSGSRSTFVAADVIRLISVANFYIFGCCQPILQCIRLDGEVLAAKVGMNKIEIE